MRKGSGATTWQLTSPLANPTYAAGGAVRFDLNDVPDRSPTGPLAYYITALILTFVGFLVNAGESPTPVAVHDMPAIFIKNVQLQNCWHGTPIASDYWLGEHLRIEEYIGGGYEFGERIPGLQTPGATTTSPQAFSVRLPLCDGRMERDTALLALLYKPASLIVNLQPASVLDGISSGTTFNGSVFCSAELDARPEIVLGTPIEWVLHREVASANGVQIQIKGFGRNSKLTGVEEKGGVVSLMELTNEGGAITLGGVLVPTNITEYGFDWRGQNVTNDVRSVLQSLTKQIPNSMPGVPQITGDDTSASNERSVFPYYILGALSGSDPINSALLAWMMVMSGSNVRLTDLESALNDQTYRLDAAPFNSGDHLILAEYAKRWTDGKRQSFVRKVQVMNDPSCLAAYVLGDRWQSATLQQRAPVDKHSLTADEMTYCAWQLEVPAVAAA